MCGRRRTDDPRFAAEPDAREQCDADDIGAAAEHSVAAIKHSVAALDRTTADSRGTAQQHRDAAGDAAEFDRSALRRPYGNTEGRMRTARHGDGIAGRQDSSAGRARRAARGGCSSS